MSLVPTSPPAVEPLSLEEARAWLRLDGGAEDAVVLRLIVAARQAVEAAAGRRLVTQGWQWRLDRWPAGGLLRVPVSPLLAVGGISVDGTPLPPSAWAVDTASDPPRLQVGPARPDPVQPLGGIAIALAAGYGPAAADVPETLRQAVRLTLAFLFEARGDGTAGDAPAALPPPALALVATGRRVRL